MVNVFANTRLLWNGQMRSLSSMVLEPIQNHIEMGLDDLEFLEEKLTATNYYPYLFEKAFGTPEITKEAIVSPVDAVIRSRSGKRSVKARKECQSYEC